MMQRASGTARGLIAAIALLGMATGCSEAPGELMLVIQTDMNLPSDLDTIRVEVFTSGVPEFKQDYERIGTTTTSLLLPATLGLVANEDDPTGPVTIQVSGRKGPSVRVVREIITPIPEGRVSTLHVPLQYLCDGSAEPDIQDLNVVNACEDGFTCKGGRCLPSALTEAEIGALPEFSAPEVFGGGTGQGDGICFDVALCFEGATEAVLDLQTCTIPAPEGDFNVAVISENAGMCNGTNCFIALDADSELGWRRLQDGRLQLPAGVCSPEPQFERSAFIGGVAVAPVGGACPRKVIGVPTCGPWSAVGDASSAPTQQPLVVVSGQTRLGALRIEGDTLAWTSGGTQNGAVFEGSSVKRAPIAGGPVVALYDQGETSPRGLAISGDAMYWTTADATPNGGALWRAPLDGTQSEQLALNLGKPEGVAIANGRLFWTDFERGEVRLLTVPATGSPMGEGEVVAPSQNRPFRIAANAALACWTNEGTLMQEDGSVWCWIASSGGFQSVATQQATPRAIALGQDAVYWANFIGGQIMTASWDGTAFSTAEIAGGQTNPNGLAVDGEDVYWTNRGDGVVRVKRGANAPEDLATGQDRPGEIVVRGDDLYWVNEGDLQTTDGRIMKLPKRP